MPYSSYDHDKLETAETMRIERRIYFEAKDGEIAPYVSLPLEQLHAMREESAAAEQAITDKNNDIASTATEYPFARNARASHRERGHFACWDSPKPLYDRERT